MKRRKRSKLGGNTSAASPEGLSTGGASSAWAIVLALTIIALAAVVAYSNSFSGPFIFDDNPWVKEDPNIRHLWPIWPVLVPSHAHMVGGRPVISFTLAVNYALGGLNVWGYHALNLAIHIMAAWTLFGIVRRTLILPRLRERFGSVATPLALAVAILWIVHPLQTEAVAYIIQRAEALVGAFYLLVLYSVIRGATSSNSMRWYLLAAVACLLGMATKEVMATAPVMVLLYDRTFLAGSFREAWRRRYGLYLAMAATWSVVALLLISTGFHAGSTGFAVREFTAWSYLLTQPGVIVHYLRLTFWPVGLCLDYGWPAPRCLGAILLPGIVVAALLALTVWALLKWPKWGFFGAWFFVILAPTSSFVPVKDAAFEHRMYLPLAAVAAGLVAGGWIAGQWLVRGGRVSRRPLQVAGGCLLTFTGAILGILTFQRNADYHSELSIWEDTVAKATNNPRAHYNLGLELVKLRRLDEAMTQFQEALELKPDFADAYNNIGWILADRGKLDEAMADYRKALEINPDLAEAHDNLGAALSDCGKLDEAMAHWRRALELKPDYAKAHNNLGAALAEHGQLDEAVFHFRAALASDPDYALAHNNYGLALVGYRRFDEAIAEYEKALEIDPNLARAHNNLGFVLANRGQYDEAIVHFQKALQIKPDDADARHNLDITRSRRQGILNALAERRELLRSRSDDSSLLNDIAWTLATNPNASVRNGAEAVERAQRAVQLSDGREPAVLGTLAAAYAEAGRFPEALETARKAIELATRLNNRSLAEDIHAKISLYEAGTPFRTTPQPPADRSIQP